ncbi:DUF4124 domain-containing protein [Marinobacter piscensis]|uniref:DUF4124 domain-containing protein n=1 Tax=Marinobacter piscensis TaxID=1562308 RepID=UPI0011A717D4|nr:DUF4124 domain-containing protein [Marinobacter piscensis]
MPGIMAVAFLVCVFSPLAVSGVYTWTDESGAVHYSDSPPAGQEHQPVNVAEPIIVPGVEAPGDPRDRSRAKRSSSVNAKAGAEPVEAKAEAVAQQERVCAGYRQKLARVQAQLRAGYGNKKGNSLRRKRRKLNRLLGRECILR